MRIHSDDRWRRGGLTAEDQERPEQGGQRGGNNPRTSTAGTSTAGTSTAGTSTAGTSPSSNQRGSQTQPPTPLSLRDSATAYSALDAAAGIALCPSGRGQPVGA